MKDTTRSALAAVREALHGSDENDRAELLEEVARAVYTWTKTRAPGGEGLDGLDGPERRSVGQVMTEAIRHHDETSRRRVE